MKIIFICGCLEPGRDGVGDYARRLAKELLIQGHEVGLISLNDSYVKKYEETNEVTEKKFLPAIRIPFSSKKLYIHNIKKWITLFDPDFLSLQFVPFAFQIKGLPCGLGNYLQMIAGQKKWHIMFHELWVGMEKGAPGKEIIWGYIQRRIILSLIEKLQPALIHTQSSLYKAQLKQLGVDAMLLPLFSNIPIVESNLVYLAKKKDGEHKRKTISLALFGGLHPGAPIRQFAQEVKTYSNKTGIVVSLLILGRGGKEQKYWKQEWEKQGMPIDLMGEQPPEEISKALCRASYGITTTVFEKVEKSGSVAAMLEHDLNVICVAAAWKPQTITYLGKIAGVMEYKAGKLESILCSTKEAPCLYRVEQASEKLIDSFENYNKI